MGKDLTYHRARRLWFRAMNRADTLRTKHAEAEKVVAMHGPQLATAESKRKEQTLKRLAARHLDWSMRLWALQRVLAPPPPEKFKRGKRKVA